MNHPVVWFEVLGNDGAKLQRYYADLFGWSIKVQGPMKYGLVETGNGTPANSGDRNDNGGEPMSKAAATKAAHPSIPGGVGGVFPGTKSWVTFYVASPNLEETMAKAVKL